MGSPSLEDLSTEELFRRFAPFVARFLYRLGVASDALDDQVQEVFLVVHRRGGYKVGPAKPTSYLATIAANAAAAYRRRRRVEQSRSSDAEVEGLVSQSKGPVQILEVGERFRLLQSALDRLEPDFRSTLILADVEGESCASIAASSGVPTGTVYWRLHEARKRFKKALRAEMAGIPARHVSAESGERERSSVLALAAAPFWLLTDARKLLRAGAAHAPVHYDVSAGLDAHRKLASTVSASLNAPGFAVPAGAGMGLIGAGSAGVAVAGAIAAAFFVHSLPPPAAEATRAASSGSVVNTAPSASVATITSAAHIEVPGENPVNIANANHTAIPSTDGVAPTTAASARSDVASAGATSAPSDVTPASVYVGPATAAPALAKRPAAQAAASSYSKDATHSRATPVDRGFPAPERQTSAEVVPVSAPSDSQLEAEDVARAERMLASNPAGALALVRGARARFKPSFLPQERDYVEVMALHALSRSSESSAAASRFLSNYPGGAFANRVRKVMGY